MCLLSFAPESKLVCSILSDTLATLSNGKDTINIMSKFVGWNKIPGASVHCYEALLYVIDGGIRCPDILTVQQVESISQLGTTRITLKDFSNKSRPFYAPNVPDSIRPLFLHECVAKPITIREMCLELTRVLGLDKVVAIQLSDAVEGLEYSKDKHVSGSLDLLSTFSQIRKSKVKTNWQIVATNEHFSWKKMTDELCRA